MKDLTGYILAGSAGLILLLILIGVIIECVRTNRKTKQNLKFPVPEYVTVSRVLLVGEYKGWFRWPISRRKEKHPPPQRTNVFNMLSYNVIYTCLCSMFYFIQVVWNSLKNIYSWSCFNDLFSMLLGETLKFFRDEDCMNNFFTLTGQI